MQTLDNIITERELLDFSQNFAVARSYLGSTLFPDRKTQYIEQEYTRLCENGALPMIAKVHALDTEAAIGSRVPFERVTVEELLIKEKINSTERLNRYTRGMAMAEDAVRRFVFDDIARMAERVVTRSELAKMDAISKGKYVISENNLNLTIDYKVPAENFVTSYWADPDADILGDIRTWRRLAMSKGATPNIAITTDAVLSQMMANKHIQTALFGTYGVGTLPTVDQINALLSSQFSGLRLVVDEDRYGTISSDGTKVVQNRFFPEGKFVLTSTGANGGLGAGLWGVTPEEQAQGGAFDERRESQYVTVTSWEHPDPVARWTKASGLFVPVMPDVYGHIIADVSVKPVKPSESESGNGTGSTEG